VTRGDDERIADIVAACSELAEVVNQRAGGGVSEMVLLRAAERLLEILGEAATQVSEQTRARYPQVDWRGLGRLRIVLAHQYHRTDPELVWQYAEHEVPALANALRA
jgi:uncharacterized protein with HEPN domain